MAKTPKTPKTASSMSTRELIDELRRRPDVIAIKVWTREDALDFAEQRVEEYPTEEDSNARVARIADGIMRNRHSRALDVLSDVQEQECDALREVASDND